MLNLLFFIQLDECTLVFACFLLVMFCRYFKDTNIKKQFLFCFCSRGKYKGSQCYEKKSQSFLIARYFSGKISVVRSE